MQELDPQQFQGDPVAQWLYSVLLPFSGLHVASDEEMPADVQLVGRRVALLLMEDMRVQVGGWELQDSTCCKAE
jgi:hypothetical protein